MSSKEKKIKIVSLPQMVLAPEWVRQPMVRNNLELENIVETTEIKVFWGVKTPIKGYQVKLVDVIEKIMVFDQKAALWLKDHLLINTDHLIFIEEKCCVLSE